MLSTLSRAPAYQPSAWLQRFISLPNISVMVSLNPPSFFTTSMPRTVFPSLKQKGEKCFCCLFKHENANYDVAFFTLLHFPTNFYKWAGNQPLETDFQFSTVKILSQNVREFETCMSTFWTSMSTILTFFCQDYIYGDKICIIPFHWHQYQPFFFHQCQPFAHQCKSF